MTRLALLAALLLAAAPAAPAAAQNFNADAPNAAGQSPAFPGQTRAPVMRAEPALRTQTVVSGLDHPWGMAALPDGSWLVTERAGRMRLVSPDGALSVPIAGLPPVMARGQGGLLDVAVKDGFPDRRVWWSFSEPRPDGTNGTSVATGTLSADGARIEGAQVIFRQLPGWDSTYHFGSRLVFAPDGALFVTTGERGDRRVRRLAQDPSTHIGKVIRIDPMGGVAKGMPVAPGWAPEVWSMGHRNLQAAALDPLGRLWTVEHGPRGGDELNMPLSGVNHGWPVITYGEDYSGAPIGKGITAQEGMAQPVYYWDPVIAPSGMVFYDGAMFPEWRGQALIGGLRSRALVRLAVDLDSPKVTGEARHLEGIGRIRDVAVAADGAVMLLIDSSRGELVRVTREE